MQRNYRKMTIKLSFFNNSFVKFHGYVLFLSHNMFMLYPNLCYNKDSVPDFFVVVFFSKKVNFQKHQKGTRKHGKLDNN